MQLQGDLQTLKKAGIQVVGISTDSSEILTRFSKARAIEFQLASDERSKAIDALGIRNEQRKDGLPHPGTFLVNREGKIVGKLFHEGYKKRHDAQAIIALAKNPKTGCGAP